MSDRDRLLEGLDAGRLELLSAIEGMSDEEAIAKPANGGWSALENVEHVAITEKLMLRRLAMQPVALVQEMSREREAVLYARISTRGRKVDAPEAALPKQRFATLGEALGAFLRTRERTLQWLNNCQFDLRSHAVEHPAVGPATVYEFVLIMAAHAARHARQIQEGRAQATLAGRPPLPDGTAGPENRS
jgi:uncharacterized damage-inducible protein DinB